MTSVATQTPWSWLQDMKQSSMKEEHEDEQWKDAIHQTVELEEAVNDEKSTLIETNESNTAPLDALVLESKSSSYTAQESSIHAVVEKKTKEELHLPDIVDLSQADRKPKEIEEKQFNLPPLLDQLETLNFPESPHSCSESSEDDLAKDDEDETKTDEDSEDEDSQDMFNGSVNLKLDNLPLPSILQYIRESDSIASNYFSLQNKKRVEARLPVSTAEAAAAGVVSPSENTVKPIDPEDATNHHVETTVVYTCEFCSSLIPHHSLLDRLSNDSQENDQVTFCCEEYKQFSVLVAACMRQMVEILHHQAPKKITIKHPVKSKKELKKTAQEKALALMRRRQKWEELQRKKSMQKHVKMKKNTTTIQFSLVSPNVMDTGWVVRPTSTGQQQQQQASQRRAKKKKGRARTRRKVKEIVEDIVPLEAETLERLTQEALHTPLRELEERLYSGGQKLSIVLPDRTGQYFYHSGKKAITVFTPYPGVLAYLVMEDTDDGFQLLAYIDELGRACCYNKDGSMRLLVAPSTALSFDQHGSLRRRWTWNDATSPSHFQPVTLTLNKQVTFKWSNKETFVLTFTASQQQHIKFIIKSKLKNDTLTDRPSHTNTEALETHLAQTKGKISQLLQTLQQSSRIQKLAELQSIYAPQKQGTRTSVPHMHGSYRDVAHKRTKSTGAITLHPAQKLRPLMH